MAAGARLVLTTLERLNADRFCYPQGIPVCRWPPRVPALRYSQGRASSGRCCRDRMAWPGVGLVLYVLGQREPHGRRCSNWQDARIADRA